MSHKSRLAIFLTVFIDLVGFGMVIPLHPYLAREFGASPLQVGLLMAIYSFLQFLFSPFWGRLSDRLGRRPILLMSLLGSTLSHLAFGLGSELWILFAARAFAGFFGANISTAMAYMADTSSSQERSKSMALIGVAFGLGFTIGPFLGGAFIQVGQFLGHQAPYGSHFAAVAASLICFVNFLITYFYLPESNKAPSLMPSQRRSSRWGILIGQIQRPTVGTLMGAFFLYSLAMANMEIPLFLYVQDHLGWSASTASYGFAYLGLVLVFSQGYLVRKCLAWWGEAWVLTLGFIISALGFGFMAALEFIGKFAPSYKMGFLLIAVSLMGLGIGWISPSINGCISLLTHKKAQGETLGSAQSLSALGRIIGPVFGGWLYKEVGSEAPFILAASLMSLALVSIWRCFKQIPHSAQVVPHGNT